jgi:ketosteroid isomerase-like protein
MDREPATPGSIELTHRVYASLNQRDFDAVVAAFATSAVWDTSRWGLGTHAGHKAIRRFLEDWFGSLSSYAVEIEELHDLGNGVVQAVVLQIASRSGSHGELRVRSAPVYLWANGVIEQLTIYPDLEQARADAAELAADMAAAAERRRVRA